MDATPDNGIIHVSSHHSALDSFQRVEAAVTKRGLPIHARIDHSGDAAKAGIKMHFTQLLIFGNAKAGTPLMLAAPSLAIDLPLKALIWEDGGGKVWISYNSSQYLQQRHNIPEALLPNISGIRAIVEEAASM